MTPSPTFRGGRVSARAAGSAEMEDEEVLVRVPVFIVSANQSSVRVTVCKPNAGRRQVAITVLAAEADKQVRSRRSSSS